MAEWIEPVFDRTLADVEYARQQLAHKVNDTEYKGCFNVSDINRIENNAKYLSEKLRELYYFNTVDTVVSWTENDVMSQSHVTRCINNIKAMWNEWGKPRDALDLPDTLITYTHVNNIEENLYVLRKMLDAMVSSFVECGTHECGEG